MNKGQIQASVLFFLLFFRPRMINDSIQPASGSGGG
jgi:hypothetical protein